MAKNAVQISPERAPQSESTARRMKGRRRTVQLSIPQMFILWVVVAGTMVLVFLFGLFAGRKMGFTAALNQAGREVVRLPVVGAPETLLPIENVQESLKRESVHKELVVDKESSQKKPAFDFRESAKGKAASVATKPEVVSGWYVQVASNPKQEQAEKLSLELESYGFPAAIQRSKVKNKIYHRTLAGPFRSRASSQTKLNEIKRLGVFDSAPFLRKIP